MKSIVKKIVSFTYPIIIIICLFELFSYFRYQEKPTPKEMKTIENFYKLDF